MTMIKAQSALEYLMIVALVLGIIIPTTYLFFEYGSESTMEILDSQINQIGWNMMDTAEIVYFSGERTKIVIDMNMPKDIKEVYILESRELVFKISSDIGETEIVFLSSLDVPITSGDDNSDDCIADTKCVLSSLVGSGLKSLKIEAVDDGSGNLEIEMSNFNVVAGSSTTTTTTTTTTIPSVEMMFLIKGLDDVLVFKNDGDADLMCGLTQRGVPTPSSNDEFIVRSSVEDVAVLDLDTGYMVIKGDLKQGAGEWDPPSSGNDFIIKNSAGGYVGYIDGITGNFYLMGTLTQNTGACP